MMKFGLKQETIVKIRTVIMKNEKVEKIVIYGSRAKGDYRNGSDIDLTLIGDLTSGDLSKMEWELDDLLLPYKIDLSAFKYISNADLREHIERVGTEFRSDVVSVK